MIIIGGPGTGKNKVIKAVTKFFNAKNVNYLLQLGNTGTSSFVISVATTHSVLVLPVDCNLVPLQGFSL